MNKTEGQKFLENLQKEAYSRFDVTHDEYMNEWTSSGPDLLDKIIKAQFPNLPQDKTAKVKDELKQQWTQTKKIEIPTKYQNPWEYKIILDIANRIETSANSLRFSFKNIEWGLKDLPLNIVKPMIGTLPTGDIQGTTYLVPSSNEYVIVFENDLLHFCNLLSKIIAIGMPLKSVEGNDIHFSTKNNAIQKNIDQNGIILQRFQELILAYLIEGTVTKATPYVLEFPHARLADPLLKSMEHFVMGHEFAHIYLKHVENKKTNADKPIVFLWKEEEEADSLSVLLTIGAMQNMGAVGSAGCIGAECFFSALEVIERGKCILKTGKDNWYWSGGKKDGPLGKHPPSETRRTKIREDMVKYFGEKSIEVGSYVQEIIKILWEKTKPLLVQKYQDRVKLNPRWSQN